MATTQTKHILIDEQALWELKKVKVEMREYSYSNTIRRLIALREETRKVIGHLKPIGEKNGKYNRE
jgi:predicted CopG family antitoxin